MADDKATSSSSSSSSRKTMAPAARRPAGEDEPLVERADDERTYLDDLPDDELDELAREVQRARLRRDRTPREPSFGISQGEQDELERTGRTVSPFTGERRGDWSHKRSGSGRVAGG